MLAGASTASGDDGSRSDRDGTPTRIVLDAARSITAVDGVGPATVSFTLTVLGGDGASSTLLDRSLRLHGFVEPDEPAGEDATWFESAFSVSSLFTGDTLPNGGIQQAPVDPLGDPGGPPVIIPLPTPGILAAAGLGALALLRRSRRQPA
jgi:MYXO-CTERM domain-containing protein